MNNPRKCLSSIWICTDWVQDNVLSTSLTLETSTNGDAITKRDMAVTNMFLVLTKYNHLSHLGVVLRDLNTPFSSCRSRRLRMYGIHHLETRATMSLYTMVHFIKPAASAGSVFISGAYLMSCSNLRNWFRRGVNETWRGRERAITPS